MIIIINSSNNSNNNQVLFSPQNQDVKWHLAAGETGLSEADLIVAGAVEPIYEITFLCSPGWLQLPYRLQHNADCMGATRGLFLTLYALMHKGKGVGG